MSIPAEAIARSSEIRAAACIAACAGVATLDLEAIAKLPPYLRLLKLSHLADRQAATMEGAPVDPYISAGVAK